MESNEQHERGAETAPEECDRTLDLTDQISTDQVCQGQKNNSDATKVRVEYDTVVAAATAAYNRGLSASKRKKKSSLAFSGDKGVGFDGDGANIVSDDEALTVPVLSESTRKKSSLTVYRSFSDDGFDTMSDGDGDDDDDDGNNNRSEKAEKANNVVEDSVSTPTVAPVLQSSGRKASLAAKYKQRSFSDDGLDFDSMSDKDDDAVGDSDGSERKADAGGLQESELIEEEKNDDEQLERNVTAPSCSPGRNRQEEGGASQVDSTGGQAQKDQNGLALSKQPRSYAGQTTSRPGAFPVQNPRRILLQQDSRNRQTQSSGDTSRDVQGALLTGALTLSELEPRPNSSMEDKTREHETSVRNRIEALESSIAAKDQCWEHSNSRSSARNRNNETAMPQDEGMSALEAAIQNKLNRDNPIISDPVVGEDVQPSMRTLPSPGARETHFGDCSAGHKQTIDMEDLRREEINCLDQRIRASNAPSLPEVVSNEIKTDEEDASLEDLDPVDVDDCLDFNPRSRSGDSDCFDLEYGDLDDETEDVTMTSAHPVDTYLPVAVEYMPDAKPQEPPFLRRFRLYVLAGVVAIVVLAIGVSVGVSRAKNKSSIAFRETVGIRENVEQLLGDNHQLNDHANPYRQALDWITYHDGMQVTPDHPYFIQRFIAAYFYYATSLKRPWATCSPASGGENESCVLKIRLISGYREHVSVRWLSNTTECSWAGVGCDGSGHITSLELNGLNMTGPVPSGLTFLPFMRSLALADCGLQGTLPSFIAEMKHLSEVDLDLNLFSGTIPENWYGRNLRFVELSGNKISGSLSPNISTLKDFKVLDLSENRLTGTIPNDMLSPLRSLRILALDLNALTGSLPTAIGELRVAKKVSFGQNGLTGTIPSEIGLLDMFDFSVGWNSLVSEIPAGLWNMTNLVTLDLSMNRNLTGSLSPRVASLALLRSLRIHGTALTGSIPTDLCDRGFATLEADCAPSPGSLPEIACECCTICCNKEGRNCDNF